MRAANAKVVRGGWSTSWVLPRQRIASSAQFGIVGIGGGSHQRQPGIHTFAHANTFVAASASAGLLQPRFGTAALLPGAGIVSSSSKAAEGVRSVGSVHRGKIVGNVVEAWERRTAEELQGTRDPANFDNFRVGDSVAVRFVNVWNTQKLATFSGICIAQKGGLLAASFTLRNHIDGFAVEQQFAVHSPLLRGIRMLKEPTKRKKRGKLYFLRQRAPKESTVVVNDKDLGLPTVP